VAVEAAMNTVCIIDLLKGMVTPWPRLESDDYMMSAGSARPLEDAFRIAQVDLIDWLGAEFDMDRLDAYQLLTQASETPVANVVDPNYTVVTKIRKRYLPTGSVYRGTHRTLREMGQAYLAEHR
jgi:acetamidase/formamidase